jgi:hypothetical protein
MLESVKPRCDQAGTEGCSDCLKEFYCSAECQKTDLKTHKVFCRLIKVMPDAVLGEKEVLSKLGMKRHIRLLQHAATFTENQFG